MTYRITANEAFEKLLSKSFLYPGMYNKPGELLNKLSPEEREALKDLKSNVAYSYGLRKMNDIKEYIRRNER